MALFDLSNGMPPIKRAAVGGRFLRGLRQIKLHAMNVDEKNSPFQLRKVFNNRERTGMALSRRNNLDKGVRTAMFTELQRE